MYDYFFFPIIIFLQSVRSYKDKECRCNIHDFLMDVKFVKKKKNFLHFHKSH